MFQLAALSITPHVFGSARAAIPQSFSYLLGDTTLQKIANSVNLKALRADVKEEYPGLGSASEEGINALIARFERQIFRIKLNTLFHSTRDRQAIGLLIIKSNFPSTEERSLGFSDLDLLQISMRKFDLPNSLVLLHCQPQLQRTLDNLISLYGQDTQSTALLRRTFPGLQSKKALA